MCDNVHNERIKTYGACSLCGSSVLDEKAKTDKKKVKTNEFD